MIKPMKTLLSIFLQCHSSFFYQCIANLKFRLVYFFNKYSYMKGHLYMTSNPVLLDVKGSLAYYYSCWLFFLSDCM